MTSLRLRTHPATPCPWIDLASATVSRDRAGPVTCRYLLRGRMERLRIADVAAAPARADGLWRHTCFEFFARVPDGANYVEYNFSPSGHWAAYEFDGYRRGMRELVVPAPVVTCTRQQDTFELTAVFTIPDGSPDLLQIAVAAVLEDREGGICYLALEHPDGRPDFHHAAGFAAQI